ncbi:phenylacetate--CoA ligase family protein [Aestuariibaculum lutulentum]|uniref:Phenylacetate--CoA ligase family protein n=1 Tax=Aestuariibaculum lutulentum TaxID=2920935 RepID=A0ABS9RGM4_9FLAO|nr:phenylacetate--CoA ligase family protein [Aestuariibaculum lutulentum]MCH4552098.1 phenylacetate--CoA ligase family protein [Aestuariibaculum lutulentum]
MNLFNLSLKLKGFPIQETNRLLHQIQSISEDKYADYLNEQKQAIIAFHLKHNPFYKTFAKNANPNNWNSIPVMTKRDLQQPLSNRLSEGFSKKNSFVNKTSGSSGDPFIFAKDKFCHALTWSGIFDRYSWYDINLNTSKQARFYGIPLDKKGYYKERLKDALGNRYRFSVFDLSDFEFEKCITKFKSTTFEYLNGYTSSIVQFAKFLKNKNLVLKDVCPTLKVCIVTSEMLFQEDRTLLETQFGIPVINEYGAAELGVIAFQNSENRWIVNSEDLFIEILDENNQVLPYGKEGRIVITSLYNKAHPFVRYDLGDVGTLSESSTLKKPVLKHLIGRTNDLVTLPSGKTAAGLTFYYVTKTVIEDSGNVKEFIIEQIQINTFKISYVSNTPLYEKDKTNIKAAVETYLEFGLDIQFERKECLNREKSGKLKQFKSYL